MITSVGALTLHLKLDQTSNGKVIDSSGKGNDGTLQGAPQVLSDDLLGSCLSLDGSTASMLLPAASVPIGNQLTVSCWAYGGTALPKNSALIEATDAKGLVTLSIRLPWGDGSISYSCGSAGQTVDSISQAAQAADFKGTWTHWAFTKNATSGTMTIYRNGVLWFSATGKTRPLPASTLVRVGATADGKNLYPGKLAHLRIYNQEQSAADVALDMEADRTALSSFRQSYPIDFGLYNDDEQEILSITDDPAGQNFHLEIKNASAQVITLSAPANATPGSNNYHFALRFRPDTLSPVFQSYLSAAVATLAGGPPPPALTGAFQAFAADTAALLQGALQKQGWSLGYQQESSGNLVLYFLSKSAQTLAPAASVVIPFAHASASSTGGAHTTRVELQYQHLTFGNDATPINGRRRLHLSIVNQSGQKHIPLHASFVGFDTILNDGQTQNTLTLRITNVLSDSPIALNPAGSHVPSKFFLSFDAQADKEVKDWALGTTSQVRAVQVMPADPKNWTVAPPTGQEESPEWTLEAQPSKTALAANEAITLTLAGIISSLASGPTHLYLRYENIPGYWDGQLAVTIEKTPLLYRGGNVGIGTTTPHGAFEVGPNVINANAWLYFQGNANGVANPAAGIKQGLMLTWNPSGGQGESQLLYATGLGSLPRLDIGRWNGTTKTIDLTLNGGNVGIGTTTPHASLDVKDSDFQISVTNAQDHNWGITNWTDDKLYFQYREQGAFKNNAMSLDKDGHLTLSSLALGNNALQQGVNWTTTQIHYHSFPDGPITVAPLTSSNALRIVGGEGGVLATSAVDVLCWASYGIVIKGNIWAENKYFRIAHPAKPDHYLIHACLEGPESSVYYRGQGQLVDGRATIHLPAYFEALTRQEGRTALLTPRGREPFLLSADEIVDGTFRVYGTKMDGMFSWEVKAVRSDVEQLVPEIEK